METTNILFEGSVDPGINGIPEEVTDECGNGQDELADEINMLVDILYEEFNDDMELFYESRDDVVLDVVENIKLLCAVL